MFRIEFVSSQIARANESVLLLTMILIFFFNKLVLTSMIRPRLIQKDKVLYGTEKYS
jgi:hypothetical protein